jgi:predicted transposase
MKLVVQTQLLPDDGQDQSLKAIVERFNEARNWVAVACFARRETNQFEVRKFAYREVRDRFGLSSQMAQLSTSQILAVERVTGDGELKHFSENDLCSLHFSRRDLCASPPAP